ncbi:tyrosine-type recombinase/integrase [Pseudomonas congelans]|uniref:site-specific integrase n=1 Tax=Pseudomonas congelans TaxID=200452 RepID=UPI001F1CD78C|nr:site-specific integrase [Pseudomonas congelans]MCF5166868.1 tyrosine-type recombinase/integrase [Pseudomonas congelans]
MHTSIRMFKASSGERFSVLVDDEGMPLYYPTLYVTWSLRARSLAANSILNSLGALKALYAWEEHYGIDLKAKFARGVTLDENQVRDLCDFLQRSLIQPKATKNVVAINRRPKSVGATAHYFRLSEVASYLAFLARRVGGTCRDDVAISSMVGAIKASRPSKPQKSSKDLGATHLDERVVDSLTAALQPGAENNPAKGYPIQLRNVLIYLILLLTGMRRGELLNIRIDDLDFAACTISIIRRPDSSGDQRTHQPTAKTRQRKIPILKELMDQIHDYVLHIRGKVPGAKRHAYLFITHKVGPTQGAALSIAGFKKWMALIGDIAEGGGFHAHALRHHWNYVFSQKADAQGMSPEREKKIRSYLMGWNETSDTAETYNKRHTAKAAHEAVLGMQNEYFGRDKEQKARD